MQLKENLWVRIPKQLSLFIVSILPITLRNWPNSAESELTIKEKFRLGPSTNVTCGFWERATVEKRNLTSPRWPHFYPNDASCEWTLQARPGLRVRVDFLFFDTEEADYLSVI